MSNWRITHILLKEDGPFQVFTKVREQLGVEEEFNTYKYKITVCHWCLSVWVALLVVVLPWQLNAIFAISAVSIMVEEWLVQKQKH